MIVELLEFVSLCVCTEIFNSQTVQFTEFYVTTTGQECYFCKH